MENQIKPKSHIATQSVSEESTSDSSLTLFEVQSFHSREATSCNSPVLQTGETESRLSLRESTHFRGEAVNCSAWHRSFVSGTALATGFSGTNPCFERPVASAKTAHVAIPCARAQGYHPWSPRDGESATSKLALRVTNHPRRGHPYGFTLLEVLLVLGILILLAAIVTPSLFNRQRKAMIHTTKISITGLELALTYYAADHLGEYPEGSPAEVFDLLMNPGTGEDGRAITPYVEQLPTDAWGQTLYYEFPTTRHRRADKPAIWSAGPDEKNDNGAHDDINNWEDAVK